VLGNPDRDSAGGDRIREQTRERPQVAQADLLLLREADVARLHRDVGLGDDPQRDDQKQPDDRELLREREAVHNRDGGLEGTRQPPISLVPGSRETLRGAINGCVHVPDPSFEAVFITSCRWAAPNLEPLSWRYAGRAGAVDRGSD
jgi:hypothetical protein